MSENSKCHFRTPFLFRTPIGLTLCHAMQSWYFEGRQVRLISYSFSLDLVPLLAVEEVVLRGFFFPATARGCRWDFRLCRTSTRSAEARGRGSLEVTSAGRGVQKCIASDYIQLIAMKLFRAAAMKI